MSQSQWSSCWCPLSPPNPSSGKWSEHVFSDGEKIRSERSEGSCNYSPSGRRQRSDGRADARDAEDQSRMDKVRCGCGRAGCGRKERGHVKARVRGLQIAVPGHCARKAERRKLLTTPLFSLEEAFVMFPCVSKYQRSIGPWTIRRHGPQLF
ncbi:hypothetical protein CEXT_501961 [Caerostris extrusa]|uniref:Uncharacterized protein n=1 Tax=Caerostris extrusa TaxID=172846 RepID=A0AAV4QWZ6_CAEEX|nr:hypothetical protein CEXT_501961 [Caerostris extrusa]